MRVIIDSGYVSGTRCSVQLPVTCEQVDRQVCTGDAVTVSHRYTGDDTPDFVTT